MEKVFISYSRKDIEFARKLAGDLKKAGYDVWWDITGLRGGDDWVSTIPAAIAASRYMLVVLTSDSIKSEWVRKEYTHALSLRKKIVPIMLTSTSVPFALNTLNYVNFMSGEYEDNFKNLLSPLGFTGKPPEVKPFNWRMVTLLSVFRRYAIPIVIIFILLLAFTWNSIFEPPQTPVTPAHTATISTTPTAVSSPETATATPKIPTPTATPTYTPTRPTPTITPTLPQEFSLPICIYIIDASANVREGPGTNYPILRTIETDGTRCPLFSGRFANFQQQDWFQFAPNQKAEFQQYAGGWISGSSLAAIDLGEPLPLPICIYMLEGGDADVREDYANPDVLQGNPIKADGSNCPFFTIRTKFLDEFWYKFAPNQSERGRPDLQQYAGGWIHESSLVVRMLSLPPVELTTVPTKSPTAAPSSTPTVTETSAP